MRVHVNNTVNCEFEGNVTAIRTRAPRRYPSSMEVFDFHVSDCFDTITKGSNDAAIEEDICAIEDFQSRVAASPNSSILKKCRSCCKDKPV